MVYVKKKRRSKNDLPELSMHRGNVLRFIRDVTLVGIDSTYRGIKHSFKNDSRFMVGGSVMQLNEPYIVLVGFGKLLFSYADLLANTENITSPVPTHDYELFEYSTAEKIEVVEYE